MSGHSFGRRLPAVLAIVASGLAALVAVLALPRVMAGPFVPPPGAPPLAEPLPPPVPPLGVVYDHPTPNPGSLFAPNLGPGISLHEIDICYLGPGNVVASPDPKVVTDQIGADHLHFRLCANNVFPGGLPIGGVTIQFGASPWGNGAIFQLSHISPFATSPRVDDPLGATVQASYAYNLIVTDPNGLVAAVLDPLLIVGGQLEGGPASPGGANDHYKCYTVEPPDPFGVVIYLDDQFTRHGPILQLQAELLCNPVDKNREGIQDRGGHLVCYAIGAVKPAEDDAPPSFAFAAGGGVAVQNQFGDELLPLRDLKRMCVPSEKDGQPSGGGPPHLKCYDVNLLIEPRGVTLLDQYEEGSFQRVLIDTFCPAVAKIKLENPEDIPPPFEPVVGPHWTCYIIEALDLGPFEPRDAVVSNQFGSESLRVLDRHSLCVPAFSKTPPYRPPPEIPPFPPPGIPPTPTLGIPPEVPPTPTVGIPQEPSTTPTERPTATVTPPTAPTTLPGGCVTPSISATPSQVSPGGIVILVATGFEPGSIVFINLAGPGGQIATQQLASSQCEVRLQIQVEPTDPPGQYFIQVNGSRAGGGNLNLTTGYTVIAQATFTPAAQPTGTPTPVPTSSPTRTPTPPSQPTPPR